MFSLPDAAKHKGLVDKNGCFPKVGATKGDPLVNVMPFKQSWVLLIIK